MRSGTWWRARSRRLFIAAMTVVGALSVAATPRVNAGFGVGVPTFTQYISPFTPPSSNEPSIGVDWATGAVMYAADNKQDKVTFDDSTTPATATWKDVTDPTSATTLDPILFVDHDTNRTFESQLLVLCSDMGYSDSDGEPTVTAPTGWTQSTGCGVHGAEDHQTVGGGPCHLVMGVSPCVAPTYPHIVYYCSQDFVQGAAAYCSESLDGGVTFPHTAAMYTSTGPSPSGTNCGGLHGHIRVSPDGTAYLPNQGCIVDTSINDPKGDQFSKQSVVVSTDNGLTWTVRPIPDSRATFYSDPSVAAGAGNTVYFGYENGGTDGMGHTVPSAGGGHPMIAVSKTQGQTWSASVDVGVTLTNPDGSTTPLGIQNTAFPAVIAGDDNRAAFAFLGSTTGGDYQAANFAGSWDLYVAFTTDGGATWTTVDATPNNPVQRGCIWLQGGSSACRNMLDFNDISVDKAGRVLVAYTKGCTGTCVTGGAITHNAWPGIARQSGGPGLFAGSSAVAPESWSVPVLVVDGVVAVGLAGWWRRRQRRSAARA